MASMTLRPLISIVTPFFNEGDGVLHFHQEITQTIDSLTDFDFDLLFVSLFP